MSCEAAWRIRRSRLSVSKVLADRGAAKPSGKCGGDALKFEFSSGKPPEGWPY